MIYVRCPKCDELHPANQEHKCAKAEPAKKRVVTKRIVVTPKKAPVTTQPAVTTVTTKTDGERVKAWRAANREHYNNYMRKRRAADKAAKEKK